MIEYEVDIPDEKEFALFQRLIEKELGIFLARTKTAMLGNRLWKRLEKTGCHNFKEYYEFINEPSHRDELEKSLELVTTNETFFFREQKHFELLAKEVALQFSGSRPLRVWSAACATGEEPYSAAMVLDDSEAENWQLIASDVNQKVIDKATDAIYLDQRTHCIPPEYLKKYFTKGVDEYSGYLRVKPEIRNKVQFRKINLTHDFSRLGHFDVIFLRNVMIYFEQDAKENLLRRIWQRLNPGGWLFTGHSESLHGTAVPFKCLRPAVYYKDS